MHVKKKYQDTESAYLHNVTHNIELNSMSRDMKQMTKKKNTQTLKFEPF